jgi:hypothetical protein
VSGPRAVLHGTCAPEPCHVAPRAPLLGSGLGWGSSGCKHMREKKYPPPSRLASQEPLLLPRWATQGCECSVVPIQHSFVMCVLQA